MGGRACFSGRGLVPGKLTGGGWLTSALVMLAIRWRGEPPASSGLLLPPPADGKNEGGPDGGCLAASLAATSSDLTMTSWLSTASMESSSDGEGGAGGRWDRPAAPSCCSCLRAAARAALCCRRLSSSWYSDSACVIRTELQQLWRQRSLLLWGQNLFNSLRH